MFGLMQNRNFRTTTAENSPTDYRMLYCGTCKSLGTMYGQRSRLLLNFDIVFLAELLTVLAEENTSDWNGQLQSLNCFHLPTEKSQVPIPLQYAATVNVLLAELKTEDNLQDSSFLMWSVIRKLFSSSFNKVQANLADFGLDLQAIWAEMQQQLLLEKAANSLTAIAYSQPTARLTAMIFAQGAAVIGKPAYKNILAALGEKFGQLVYLLDAYKDYEKDVKQKEFNAFRVTIAPNGLNDEYKTTIFEQLYQLENEISQTLRQLPLSPEIQQLFFHRLEINLAAQLSDKKEKRPLIEYQSVQSVLKMAKNRWQKAREFASIKTESLSSVQWALNYNILLAAAFVAPKLPQHLPQQPTDKPQWTFWAIMAATLAALGLGKKAVKTCKTMPKNGLPLVAAPVDCCSDCFSSCASECCESCVQSMCNACCDSCCDSMCNSINEDARTIMGLVVLGLLLIAVIVVLIVIYV